MFACSSCLSQFFDFRFPGVFCPPRIFLSSFLHRLSISQLFLSSQMSADAKIAKFSAGKAKFTFRDFLRKNCLELKLCSDFFPLKRDEIDNTNNLDLNTTATKDLKTVEKASPYLVHNTYTTIMANLARPIDHFDEE